jgi:AraC-like DNA-binding protein
MLAGETGVALEFGGVGASERWRRALDDEAAALFAGIGPERGFSGYYVAARVGEAIVADVRAQPLALRDQIAANQNTFLLQAVVEGRPGYQRESELHLLRAGQVILRPQDAAVVIRSDRFARVITVALPQHLLCPRYASAEALAACAGPAEDALPTTLLHQLIAGLPNDGFAERSAAHVLSVIGGLVGLVLARKPQSPQPLSELTAQRAAEVAAYLARNFSNPGLDPQTLADDLSISVRYAHKLMRSTGRSFREALTELRLEAARQAFAANAAPRQTIADIAISVGFNDLSQFNRHFRGAYGMTPRAARRLDETNGYAGRTEAGEAPAS